MKETIRTYPDLSQVCLLESIDLPLRLWYLLRDAIKDNNGDGWYTESEMFDLSVGNKRQTRAWLRRGLNVFWSRYGSKYKLAGLGTVCERLAVKLPKACVGIPRERIESLATFRAALYASWFVDAGDDGQTISQAALSELFGRTDRTLRIWAALAGLGVTHNMAIAPIPKSEDELDRYPNGTLEAMGWEDLSKDPKERKDRPNAVWFERHDDHLMLTWKMVSTYAMTAWTPGPKTTLQKRASRRAPSLRGVGANPKVYYSKDAKGGAVAKAIQRGGPVYLETGATHEKTGDQLWSRLA